LFGSRRQELFGNEGNGHVPFVFLVFRTAKRTPLASARNFLFALGGRR